MSFGLRRDNTDLRYGGRLRFFACEWRKLTSDMCILDIVSHCHIDFTEAPSQLGPPRCLLFGTLEWEKMHAEIGNLLRAAVVEACTHVPGEFISPIFSRPKKNGSVRIILNLKDLNDSVEYHHFKMDNRQMAARLMTKNCFMASIDITQAYYMVPVAREQRKFLRFFWAGSLYQFAVLPNGLACAPRLFTKLLKPVYATLRQQGVQLVGYIDDTFIVHRSLTGCADHTRGVRHALQQLGFLINEEKSVEVPAQKLCFLGYLFDSRTMQITLPEEKVSKLKREIEQLRAGTRHTIQRVAEVLGLFVAYCEAADFGQLHYRALERDKIWALKASRGNYSATLRISPAGWRDISWWSDNADTLCRTIYRRVPDTVITSDASLLGWGAHFEDQETGGRWSPWESLLHINVLECLAGLFAIKCFCKSMTNTAVQLRMDNTTAVAYVNHMGGSKSVACDKVARQLWDWCIHRNIWLSACHIPGRLNTIADRKSREFDDTTEWALHDSIFARLVAMWGMPSVDLFASRLNKKVDCYVAWHPDPHALFIDAFAIDWAQFSLFYAFPPFSLMGRCLQKIREEGAQGIMVAPDWPTQPWWPVLQDMMTGPPLIVPHAWQLLTSPTGLAHPLRKLRLIICNLCGRP